MKRPTATGMRLVDFLAVAGWTKRPERVCEAYSAGKYARLAEIKARYDPDNVIRHKSNIRPDA